MMRTLSASACALALLAITAPFARADDAAVHKSLEKQYAKISQAYKTKKIQPYLDVLTPDYTMSLPTGKTATRQQMTANFNTYISFVQTVTGASEALSKLIVKGNTASVNVLETIKGAIADPQSQGKVHDMSFANQYQDTWVKSGANWLRKHSTLVKATIMADGQTIDLGAQLKEMSSKMQSKGSPALKK